MRYAILKRKVLKRMNAGAVRLPALGEPRGRALLSYMTAPFLMDGVMPQSHSNYWECSEIARLLRMRGLADDVIDWDNRSFIPRSTYDIAIDIHANLDRLADHLGPQCVKVFHATGSYWEFQNAAEKERLTAIEERRRVRLVPHRTLDAARSIERADIISGLGNRTTFATYGKRSGDIVPIPLSTTGTFPSPAARDFDGNRRRFLWLGGGGAALKGLDIVLETFAAMPDMELAVCGPLDAEPDFALAYRKELHETPDIRAIGRVDIASEEFRRLVESSIALVYPSASEGQSGSVVTCLHAGLIPIVSDRTGVDVEEFGTVLERSGSKGLQAAVREIVALPTEHLRERSVAAWRHARLQHTRWTFSNAYDAFLSRALSEHEPLVSVIIPAYDAEATVEVAVQSILTQTHQNLEVIVVDDMSKDGMADVIKGIAKKDHRVTYRRLDQNDPHRFNKNGRNINAGYSARNAGLAEAKGEWITFQDADDASFPERIATQLALARFYGARHLTVDWMPYSNERVGRHFDVEGFIAFEDGRVIGKRELRDLARRTKGVALSVLGPLHRFIPFSVKTARVVNKFFFGSLDPYPGSGNSPLFRREYLSRLRFRPLPERIWPSFVGRGADRDFNFQASDTFGESVVVKIQLYLWRSASSEGQEGFRRYIL